MTVATVVDGDLDQVVRSIWEALFPLPLDVADRWSRADGPVVTAVVRIEGAWHGAVLLRCAMPLATMLTASMFGSDGDVSEEEVDDALGELANITGGNVKALLPEPCRLSLPAVSSGPEGELGLPGHDPVATASFTYAGRPFVVLLLGRRAEGGG